MAGKSVQSGFELLPFAFPTGADRSKICFWLQRGTHFRFSALPNFYLYAAHSPQPKPSRSKAIRAQNKAFRDKAVREQNKAAKSRASGTQNEASEHKAVRTQKKKTIQKPQIQSTSKTQTSECKAKPPNTKPPENRPMLLTNPCSSDPLGVGAFLGNISVYQRFLGDG